MIPIYQRGTTIRLKATIKDADGALMDPGTSIQVSVTDPAGATALAGTAMTKSSTGVYYYDWQTSADATKGLYKQKVTAVDSSKTSIEVDDSAFELTDK